jgi:uncharacterized membrane protein YkvA (DUF1232 family)
VTQPARNLRAWARGIKRETHALYLAARDRRTPWYARALAVCVVAYALSPIDLIPDVVPVLGYLDDVILVPLGISLALRLIPPAVMASAREEAASAEGRPVSRAGAVAVVVVWLLLAALGVAWGVRALGW